MSTNQNERSAEGLQWWIEMQKVMKAEAEAHLQTLQKMHAASLLVNVSGKADPWLDDAIKHRETAIDNLAKSIEKSEEFLEYAQTGTLHDPRCS